MCVSQYEKIEMEYAQHLITINRSKLIDCVACIGVDRNVSTTMQLVFIRRCCLLTVCKYK